MPETASAAPRPVCRVLNSSWVILPLDPPNAPADTADP